MAIRFIPENISEFYGNVPLHDKGLNKGRINRKLLEEVTGFNNKQIQKAYINWIEIFRYKDSTLKFSEYLEKLLEANINPDKVGIKNSDYNLSRYNDLGSYSKENCRFILKLDNLQEQFHPSMSERQKELLGSRYRGKNLSQEHRKNISEGRKRAFKKEYFASP